MRKTKIVATIGPKSLDPMILKNMIKNGVDVLRINFSHCDISFLNNAFVLINKLRKELGQSIAIMVDTRGPEVRLGNFKENKVVLKNKQKFVLDDKEQLGDDTRVKISEPKILKNLTANDVILLNDGQVELKVESCKNNFAQCVVVRGGEVFSKKSVTFKDVKLNLNYIDKTDEEFLKISLQNKCDIISASFVSSVEDINKIKALCKQKNHFPLIISKIENGLGIQNIDTILKNCDGIMVARGDLGCYYLYKQIPYLQKMLVQKANDFGKISIVATEILESMVKNSRPTRAETSDIALAVSQNASALMLSAETAVGNNPALCIQTMSSIILECEENSCPKINETVFGTDNNSVISQCAVYASKQTKSKAIVVFTDTGKSAVAISRCNPCVPVVAVTKNKEVFYKLNAYYGVVPYLYTQNVKDINAVSVEVALNTKIAKKNDKVITVTGTTDTLPNLIKINIV